MKRSKTGKERGSDEGGLSCKEITKKAAIVLQLRLFFLLTDSYI
jgi:hypothetical protein